MKELKKPIPIETEEAEINLSCNEVCKDHAGKGCKCKKNPESISTEDDILF